MVLLYAKRVDQSLDQLAIFVSSFKVAKKQTPFYIAAMLASPLRKCAITQRVFPNRMSSQTFGNEKSA